MILPLPQSILQAEEIEACTERILKHITEAIPTEPAIQFMLPLIARDRAALKKALSNSRSSAFTQQIAEADEIRDDAFVAFRKMCESATLRHSKPDFIAAGQLLMQLIFVQGYSLQNMGNTAQTGVLNALFTSLEEETAVAAIALIGAGEHLSELIAAQTNFEKVINSRTDEQAAKDYPQLADAKSQLGKRLQALLSVIDSLDAADLSATRPEIDVLISQINDTLASIIAPARARRTRKSAADEPAPSPTV